jgi:CarD family transcriptional regulator
MKVIRGRARIKRTMWSRRAQEYDAKINSGDLIAVAEVVRDLYRSDRQPEQSYSERQLFEQALFRMARELAAVRKIDDDQSIKELSEFLAKNAKRVQVAGEKAAEDAAAEAAEEAA